MTRCKEGEGRIGVLLGILWDNSASLTLGLLNWSVLQNSNYFNVCSDTKCYSVILQEWYCNFGVISLKHYTKEQEWRKGEKGERGEQTTAANWSVSLLAISDLCKNMSWNGFFIVFIHGFDWSVQIGAVCMFLAGCIKAYCFVDPRGIMLLIKIGEKTHTKTARLLLHGYVYASSNTSLKKWPDNHNLVWHGNIVGSVFISQHQCPWLDPQLGGYSVCGALHIFMFVCVLPASPVLSHLPETCR